MNVKNIIKSCFAVLLLLVTFGVFTALCSGAAGVSKKSSKTAVEIEFETKDGFILHGSLSLPTDKRAKYPLVVLMHSVGYSSKYWQDLPSNFLKAGFAVASVDFRGHGRSIYDAKFRKKNWIYMSEKTFLKYPSDILALLDYVGENYKNIAVNHVVLVGADIGANTAILTADKMKVKPQAMVLFSPSTKFKGLYTPIALANLGYTPIFTVVSNKDQFSKSQAVYLKRFSQGEFTVKTYPNGGAGMLMLKVNPGMSIDVVNWVVKRMNEAASKKK